MTEGWRKMLIGVAIILFLIPPFIWYFSPGGNRGNDTGEKSAAGATATATGSVGNGGRLEAVSVPYGKDDNGKEIYSEPVLVTEGRFSYGFDSSDPGTGCLKVRVKGEERGTSCAGHYLDLAMTDGGEEKVPIQFHGVERPMKLIVRHSM